MPVVSVLIPTYNRADIILEAIGSVQNQTFSDYEIIVVDDGSTDNTREVLEPLVKKGVVQYIYQENAGVSAARNHGLRKATGKYIAFLDSDDVFVPTKLEKQVKYLEDHEEAVLVHSGYTKFSKDVPDMGYRDTSFYNGRIYPKILLYWSVLMAVPCVMLRASVFEEVGYFDETLKGAEDLDYWRRIARLYPIAMLREPLSKIRTHGVSMSSDKTDSGAMFRVYLEKAFEEDRSLNWVFRRQVLARMYAVVGHTLLGEGNLETMKIVRRSSLKAIGFWPLEWRAYLGLLGSLLGNDLRRSLAQRWRGIRNKPVRKPS